MFMKSKIFNLEILKNFQLTQQAFINKDANKSSL